MVQPVYGLPRQHDSRRLPVCSLLRRRGWAASAGGKDKDKARRQVSGHTLPATAGRE